MSDPSCRSIALFFTFLTSEGFAALGEEDDRGVEELGLCWGEVGVGAEVEAVGAGEEGDRLPKQ